MTMLSYARSSLIPLLSMYSMHSNLLRELEPDLNEADLYKQVSMTFPAWFKTYVCESLFVKSIVS